MPPVTFQGSYGQFKKAIIGQESGGRYGVVNPSSGAASIGQIMPATGQSLAKRLGLPWRPDLMTGSHGEARQYQDALTEAAVREAWDYSKGNPAIGAMYYHGGSDRGKWGPKTRRYASDILRRLGMN